MSIEDGPWAWLTPHGYLLDPIGSLLFARGVTLEQVFVAYGADPADAVERTYAEVDPELVELPGRAEDLLRVRRVGDWVVASEPSGVGPQGDDVTRRVARHAAEVLNLTSVAIKGFQTLDHYRDGQWRTQVQLGVPDGAGADPDRFDVLFARAGYGPEAMTELGFGARAVVALDVLGRELGFTLSAEQYFGSMPTVTTRRLRRGP